MPLFTLPLSGANGEISRSHSTSRPSQITNIGRKRKRAPSPAPDSAPSQSTQINFASSPAPSQISAHIANPLSLNDQERAQYLLAGLPLDAELPSTTYTQFPRRPLPEDAIIEDGGWTTAGEQTDVEVKTTRQTKGSHLKLRHLGVLTTIVQRCLLEGDIKRATKAWSLLLRAQVGGKGIDLRSTSYWGIGAELLIRAGQCKPLGKKPLANVDEDTDEDLEHDDNDALRRRQEAGPPSWGTKEGIQAAKAYYERLILQHPYMRQFSATTLSSLDFWPAMLSCEVYGVQQEYTTAMTQVSTHEEGLQTSDTDEITDEEDSLADESIDHNDPDAHQTRMEELETRRLDRLDAKREEKRIEKEWTRKEVIRRRALEAATVIATRMDELMTGPPWTDSPTLLRLRGCVALWVGDLSVPTAWVGKETDDEDSRLNRVSRNDNGRNVARARKEEDRRRATEVGKARRKEAREDAKTFFLKAEMRGARCPDLDMDMDENMDEDETERTF